MRNVTLLKQAFALFFSILISPSIFSQTVGSFDATINFAGSNRQISAYVPTNYNPSNPHKLIVCLHGLGDNSANYRNALVNTLNWKTLLPNTIFVFPESSATTADYFAPTGSGNEEIIKESINFIRNNYTIDSTNIILQGFSLGGRAALRYGLNNPALFKGLLLNTPAIQGVKEGTNKQPLYPFNVANANKVPIFISHGENDALYTAPIDSIVELLILNDYPMHFNRVVGLDHTIPFPAQLGNFSKFFDSATTVDYGIEVSRLYIAERTCHLRIYDSILVRNTGKTTITSITLDFSIPGSVASRATLSGLSIEPFKHAVLPITNMYADNQETQTYKVKATRINDNISTDPISPNNENQLTKIIVRQDTGRTLPFFEGFEGVDFPPAGWTINASGDLFSAWNVSDDVKKAGKSSLGAFNTILFFDNFSRTENLQTPGLNLKSLASPFLTFDYAFNYHKFKAGNDSLLFADTLEVLISNNCDTKFTSLFKAGGKDLATFALPILNPNAIEKCFISPTDSNWKTITLPLNNFDTSSNAIISFNYKSAGGGSINIDNISVSSTVLGIKSPSESLFALYPNPTKNQVYIDAENIIDVKIYDASGKQCPAKIQQQSNTSYMLTTQNLSAGIYYVMVTTKNGVQNQKMIIEQ